MSQLAKYAVIVSVCAGIFIPLGRWLSPEKVITKTVTVEVDNKSKDTQIDKDKDKHKKTTIVETTDSDGKKTKTTVVTEDTSENTKTNQQQTESSQKSEVDTKEVTSRTQKVTVAAMVGSNIGFPLVPIYGGSVSKSLLGPIQIGVWGLTNATFGASLGIQF